tara:strand:- start:597 stop:959 length:363 start_codon:yes stop_codon:yes gene_type:complete
MKKFFTILIFILFSNTATAKEYLMTCSGTKYKLINTFFSKKLHVRKDAQWLDYCDGFGNTLEIYEDGAKCTMQLEGKDVFVNDKWRKQDRIDTVINLDFYLKTLTFNNRVDNYKNTSKCR